MSIKGNIDDSFALEGILQSGLASEGDGHLTLRSGARFASMQLAEDGLYVLQPDLLGAELVLNTFVARGLIDPDLLRRMSSTGQSKERVLDALIADGTLPEAELMEILAAEIEDTVLDVMLWEDGSFRFQPGQVMQQEHGLLGRIAVDTTGVTERALARIDERRAIGDRLGDGALLFFPSAGELPPLSDPHDPLHAIYARLDGRNIAHEIALQLGVSRFAVLGAVSRLVEGNVARVATSEELVQQATSRAAAGQIEIARALVQQWAEQVPDDEGPLKKLASLAADSRNQDAELEALCALGNLRLRMADAPGALEVFKRAMRKAPADEVVLAGLRVAAEATGDTDALVSSALLTAQTHLDEEDTEGALRVLSPLLLSHSTHMGVLLMQARALVQSEQRPELLAHAEKVGQVLAREGTMGKAEREAVEFFRDAIETVAPDRGDLIERFRALHDSRRSSRPQLAIIAGLLLLLSVAGFYFWPASAASVWASAQEAADAGDTTLARELIGDLVSRFPESEEAEQAFQLQARLVPQKSNQPRKLDKLQVLKKNVSDRTPGFKVALSKLPAEAARDELRVLLEMVHGKLAPALRQKMLKPLTPDVEANLARLLDEVLARVTPLAETAAAHERLKQDPQGLRAFLDDAAAKRDPAWQNDVKLTAELVYEITKLSGEKKATASVRELARAAVALKKAIDFHDKHAIACRQTLASLDIQRADDLCRMAAPRLLIAGQLDEADAIYDRFETLLRTYGEDPTYAPLIDGVKRRRLPEFVAERRAQIADIQARIAAAKEKEQGGDLQAALDIYSALLKDHWLIRFDKLFTLPMRVESMPLGARVFVDDKEVGRTPTIIRYVWESKTTLRLEAPGYGSTTQSLLTSETKPQTSLQIDLVPATLWRTKLGQRGSVEPIAAGPDVLHVTRTGQISLHAGEDGHVLWTRDYRSLEGVRGRPASAGGLIYIPRVNGRVLVLDVKDGAQRAEIALSRPKGDMGALEDAVALTTTSHELVVLRDGKLAFKSLLTARPAGSVLGAHGAFWVGTAEGSLVRVDVQTRRRNIIVLAGKNVPLVGLAATPGGVLATTSDGSLVALDAAGQTLWKRPGLGHPVGQPVPVGDFVAVTDRAGHIKLVALSDGSLGATIEIGASVRSGLLGAGGDTLMACCDNGYFWAYHVKSAQRLVNVDVGGVGAFHPALIGPRRAAISLDDCCLALITIPQPTR